MKRSNCFVTYSYITISVSPFIFKHIKHTYFIFCIEFPDLNFWQDDSAICPSVDSGLWCLSSLWVLWYLIVNSPFLKLSVEIQWHLDLNCVPPKKICFYFTRYQETTYLQLVETKSPVCVQIIINSCAHLISMNADPQSTSVWWDISWGSFLLLLPPLPPFSSFFYFSSSFFIAFGSSPNIFTVKSTLPTSSAVGIGFFSRSLTVDAMFQGFWLCVGL